MTINTQTLEQYLTTRHDYEQLKGVTFILPKHNNSRVLMLYGDDRTAELVFIVKGNELIPAQIIDGKVSMVIR